MQLLFIQHSSFIRMSVPSLETEDQVQLDLKFKRR